MKHFRFLKNKKGIVMETAVIFMLCIFLFCFVLSTTSLISYNRVKIESTKIKNDINIDLMIEDYLAYIATVYVAPPANLSPETTQAAPITTEETTQDNKSDDVTTVPEPTLPPEPEEPAEPLNLSVDIMPEIPLLFPIDNVSETTGSSVPENTVSQSGAVPLPTVLKFEEYLNYNLDKMGHFQGYQYTSDVVDVGSIKMFTLTVYNDSCIVLNMRVLKSNLTGTPTVEIQYVNKSGQINN